MDGHILVGLLNDENAAAYHSLQ